MYYKEIVDTLIGVLSRFKGVNYVKYTGDDLINQQNNNKNLQVWIDNISLSQYNLTTNINKIEFQVYILGFPDKTPESVLDIQDICYNAAVNFLAYNGEKGYREITASIYDDNLITQEEIEELKKGYPPLAFAQEFECIFLDNALTVFPNFETCFDCKYEDNKRCWCGIDPSSVGDDNTIVSLVNINKQVKQYKIDGTLDQKYERIAKIINEYNPVATYIENNSIGEVMANEIKKKLIKKGNFYTFTTTNETKKDYISLLAVDIANNNIHFEESNRLLYSELATFTFKLTKTGNITYAAKDGYHDDTVTSLGIALQCKEDFKFTGENKMNFVKMPLKQII